jgi:hypothetical protein
VRADAGRPALRLRPGSLTVRALFVVYLVVIVVGITYCTVIGLLHL